MINIYKKLEIEDIRNFEQELLNWGRKNNRTNSFVFDVQIIFELSGLLQKEDRCSETNYMNGIIIAQTPSRVRKMHLKECIIEWYAVGGHKCLLKKVSTKSGEIIYSEPSKW